MSLQNAGTKREQNCLQKVVIGKGQLPAKNQIFFVIMQSYRFDSY